MKGKNISSLLHTPILVTYVQTRLGPHCSYLKMKYPTVKTLARCTNVTACRELRHLNMLYVHCPDFSKHSLFAYPHYSDHEDMPLS